MSAPTTRPPRPTATPARDYRFPHFQRETLSNGIELVVAPVHKLPMVSALMVIDGGAATDPAGSEGVAELTAQLLAEGTERSDGAELAERFEMLGASIDARADWDGALVSVTSLSSRLPEAMALLGEVIRTPGFRERDVERLKAERMAELLQLRAEPRGLASEMFSRVTYNAQSRYARPDSGDETSVRALDADVVRRFYTARYRPAGTTLVMAGDVGVDDAVRLANEAFGGWSGAGAQPVTVDDQAARSTRAVHVVAKSDAPQSELRIGHVGLPRLHPDYFPVLLMNAILGGLFSSRINLNLRERHGYTYGAFSSFDWRRQAGPFEVSTAVKSEVTAEAVREVLVEIDRMREAPVTDDELSLASSYLDGVFPIRYETTAAIAAAIAGMVTYRLPEDHFDRYRERVRAVTTADILRVAREHLRPEALQILAVGDPEAIRGPLEAAALGPVTVYDAEGHVTA